MGKDKTIILNNPYFSHVLLENPNMAWSIAKIIVGAILMLISVIAFLYIVTNWNFEEEDLGRLIAVFVGVGVLLGVSVNVGVFVGPGVLEGVAVGNAPVFNKLKPSKSLLVCAHALPSKYNAGENVQAVALPRDVGVHTNTSSSSPETPVTENSPLVDR